MVLNQPNEEFSTVSIKDQKETINSEDFTTLKRRQQLETQMTSTPILDIDEKHQNLDFEKSKANKLAVQKLIKKLESFESF